MTKPTHTVGTRLYTYGRWLEPGTPVDATDWPNQAVLEESGYLHPVPQDGPRPVTPAELGDEAALEPAPVPAAPARPGRGRR